MTLQALIERLDELLLEENRPTMVLIMAQFCKSRGYIPRDKSINEMVIQFFQGNEMNMMTLVGEFNMPSLYAKSFMVDLRHLKKFNGI